MTCPAIEFTLFCWNNNVEVDCSTVSYGPGSDENAGAWIYIDGNELKITTPSAGAGTQTQFFV